MTSSNSPLLSEASYRDYTVERSDRRQTTRRRAKARAAEPSERFKLTGDRRMQADDGKRTQQPLASGPSQFAGDVHDLINLLAVIDCYAEAGVRAAQAGARLKAAETIRETAIKAASLARRLLDVPCDRGTTRAVIDVNDVIRSIASMIESLVGDAISVCCRLEAAVGTVEIDADELSQVLLNLISNARDAMPRGGIIGISTANTARCTQSDPPSGFVTLTVTDTGTGMDAHTRERIFDPFFTTKRRTKGSGLGLASVREIVERSRGCVHVLSKPGTGTSFAIHLPCGP
jgi:two-component system cell cycle sensor histidine kinase/response regulator CckA